MTTCNGSNRSRPGRLSGGPARGATCAIGTPGHLWQLTAKGKTPAATKGIVHMAEVMATMAADVVADPARLAQAKSDQATRLTRMLFGCPLPDGPEPLVI